MKLCYDKKFYKDLSDKAAQQVGEALVAPRRPLHIEIDGEYLKTALIELRADDIDATPSEKKVAPEEFRQFERKYTQWKETQPLDARSWEFYAASHNLIRLHGLHGVYVGVSGMKRPTNWSVVDPIRLTRFSKLHSAMQAQYAKVDWAKRKELQELESKMFPA